MFNRIKRNPIMGRNTGIAGRSCGMHNFIPIVMPGEVAFGSRSDVEVRWCSHCGTIQVQRTGAPLQTLSPDRQ